MPRKIVLRCPLSPGDVVVSTALIRDIKRAHGDEVLIDYRGTAEETYWHSPHLTQLDEEDPEVERIRLSYSLVHRCNQTPWHFLCAYYKDFEQNAHLRVPMTEFKPELHFTNEELSTPIVEGEYWVVCAGGKYDYTAKWWDPVYWQEAIDGIAPTKVVQVGEGAHQHPKLHGVIDMRGRTSLRELMRLILHARGVLCVVTCLMPMAAACNRPCVVVAGGREPWTWQAFTRKTRDINMKKIHGQQWQPPTSTDMIDHIYLHTVGKHDLKCCATGGCWKSKIDPDPNSSECKAPVDGPSVRQPKCLTLIKPQDVVDGVKL